MLSFNQTFIGKKMKRISKQPKLLLGKIIRKAGMDSFFTKKYMNKS